MKMLTKKTLKIISLCLVFVMLFTLCGCSVRWGDELQDVQLNQFFGNNMVLARNRPVAVFGTGTDGTKVTVSFAEQTKNTVVENGEWLLYLDEMEASTTPRTLSVSAGGKTKIITGVLVGEVWFCTGQSNMVYEVAEFFSDRLWADFGDDGNNPLVRMAAINSNPWLVSTSENVGRQPAYAAAFAEQLQMETGVPVGFLVRAIGGSRIDLWLEGTTLYKMYIETSKHFSFSGILWYQGENDTTHLTTYLDYYKQLTTLFRSNTGDPTIPFVATQLANYALDGDQARAWADMRLMQIECMKAVPNSYLVCQLESTRDVAKIHPDDKKNLGRRAGKLVAEVLGVENVYGSSPLFESATLTENGILVTFSGVNVGLSLTSGTEATEFRICGADGVFKDTTATIVSKNQVLVSTASVEDVYGVSYCDVVTPVANLRDGESSVFNFQHYFKEVG